MSIKLLPYSYFLISFIKLTIAYPIARPIRIAIIIIIMFVYIL
nr:MAG TPA: hypothetical protein [Caudoviricetes sp.]DAS44937.1 MAG TPA: hypothetical protein [Caudoviricetes sp.]